MAIDGSKFKASNHSRRHYTQEQLRELPGKIEARIEEYLSELDGEDQPACIRQRLRSCSIARRCGAVSGTSASEASGCQA